RSSFRSVLRACGSDGPLRAVFQAPPCDRRATTTSADFSLRRSPASPFQAQGEISPGKNAVLRRTTVGSTPPVLGHESFAVIGPLALDGTASYPLPVRRPATSLPASSPRSVTLPQLRLASLAVASSREDFHHQDSAHAGRTKQSGRGAACFLARGTGRVGRNRDVVLPRPEPARACQREDFLGLLRPHLASVGRL